MRKISWTEIIPAFRYFLRPEQELESEIESFFSKRHDGQIFILNKGRTALQAAIEDFGLAGSEVIVPSFICSDVFVSAFINNNIKPVVIDCRSGQLNMNIADVKKKTTKKTKAIVLVHTLGVPDEPEKFRRFCDKNKIILIEDCAHCIDLKYKNKYLGSYGDAAIFSFAKETPDFAGGVYLRNKKILQKKNAIYKRRYVISKLDLYLLFNKLPLSRYLQNIRNGAHSGAIDGQIGAKEKITDASKLSKALFVYYIKQLDIMKKIKIAELAYSFFKSQGIFSVLSLKQIRASSAKSLAFIVKDIEGAIAKIRRLGLTPGRGWTPCFSDNKLSRRWSLPKTPIAKYYSENLLVISVEEISVENIGKISKIIKSHMSNIPGGKIDD